MAGKIPLETCRIVVINEILETRTVLDTPQTVEEAMKNHGLVRLAMDWIAWHGTGDDHLVDGSYENLPIAVCIHQTAGQILVRWYAVTADEAEARAAMHDVLAGEWMKGGEAA